MSDISRSSSSSCFCSCPAVDSETEKLTHLRSSVCHEPELADRIKTNRSTQPLNRVADQDEQAIRSVRHGPRHERSRSVRKVEPPHAMDFLEWIELRQFFHFHDVCSQFLAMFAVTGRSTWLLYPAVLLCCVSVFLERALRVVGSRVTFALQCCCLSQFFALVTVIASPTCHLCSTAISGRKRECVACSTPLRLFRGSHLLLLA